MSIICPPVQDVYKFICKFVLLWAGGLKLMKDLSLSLSLEVR